MPRILWTGRLSPAVRLMVNLNSIFGWASGSFRNTAAMKERVRRGYDGACTDHVDRYDELGNEYQRKNASLLLEPLNLRNRKILDVGGGTGILSFLSLQRGAARVICGDISQSMLERARQKASVQGYGLDRIEFRQMDAESLPFEDSSFDVVVSGMTLGFLPNQAKAVAEMARVLRVGGRMAIATHGPEHFWEASEACFRCAQKRYILGYRLEFWPQTERSLRLMLRETGLDDVTVREVSWREAFQHGEEAYDFFLSVSAAWWYARFPPEKIADDVRRTREYFSRKSVCQLTHHVVLAFALRR